MQTNNGTATCAAESNARAIPVTYVRCPTFVNDVVT